MLLLQALAPEANPAGAQPSASADKGAGGGSVVATLLSSPAAWARPPAHNAFAHVHLTALLLTCHTQSLRK